MLDYPVFLGIVELSDGDEHPLAMWTKLVRFCYSWGSGTILIEGKQTVCMYGLLRIKNCCNYVVNGYKLGEIV